MNADTALLIIDMQVGLLAVTYRSSEILDAINVLLSKARAAGIPVIYVQHGAPPGYELAVGTPGWEIHPVIAPHEGEPVVHKRASDSFHRTTLQQELEKHDIKHLVVVGGQTDYCVDTTARRATTLGYDVTLVEDAHTTEDNSVLPASQIIAHHNNTLNGFRTDQSTIMVKPTRDITF
jgi:nicotinamidase-related amidase